MTPRIYCPRCGRYWYVTVDADDCPASLCPMKPERPTVRRQSEDDRIDGRKTGELRSEFD